MIRTNNLAKFHNLFASKKTESNIFKEIKKEQEWGKCVNQTVFYSILRNENNNLMYFPLSF